MMSHRLLLAALASLPGWALAIVLDEPFLGWPLAVLGMAVAFGLGAAESTPVVVSSQIGWQTLEREVARARRHGDPLTLVRIGDADASPADLAAITARIREVDVAWRDDAIWLVAIGAGDLGAQALMGRLRQELPGLASAGALRSMTFPTDALTVNALVDGLTTEEPRPVRLPVPAAEEMAFNQEMTNVGGSGA